MEECLAKKKETTQIAGEYARRLFRSCRGERLGAFEKDEEEAMGRGETLKC